MKIIRGIKNLKIKSPTAVTIGIFDGIHKGHRKVLKELKKYSRIIKGKSCVITFMPHPMKVLMPKMTPPAVISPAHKMRLLEAEGIDIVLVINFTKSFAAVTPLRFANDVLKKLNTKVLLIGDNFVLGRDRSGNVQHLKDIGKRLGFKVVSVPPLMSGKKIISSTLVRKLIMSGDFIKAKKLLGRYVSVLGTVCKGAERGRTIGFPTANINPHHEAIPPSGVYIVKARLDGKQYRGILNIGSRPTFYPRKKDAEPVIEAHIFDFNKPIYGRDMEISFLKKIRDEKNFGDKHKLAIRVGKDAAIAKRYFAKAHL